MTYLEFADGYVMETENPQFHPTGEKITKKAFLEKQKQNATDSLKRMLKAGDTVYTVLRHVSASGMTRHIDLYVMKDNKPVYLSGFASQVLEYKRADKGNYALIVGGCGMDMGFHLVYTLSRKLFNDGYALNHQWL